MAAFMGFPSSFPPRTCQIKSKSVKISQPKMWLKPRNSDQRANQLSPSETVKQFYACINERDLRQLTGLVSEDCSFDDCSFLKPFRGRKEVMEFFGQLMASMGQNMEFKIGLVCEGDDYTIGVTWHLEWNKIQIPFTRGCSFYKCSMDEARLVIERAQVMIESPVKPGGSVLILLKILTSLFDAFPKTADWFLRSPHVLLLVLIKVYSMALGPFISPFLTWYINLWKFMARLLGYALEMVLFISKFFK